MTSTKHSYQLIKRSELEKITGLSRSSIYDRMNPKSRRYDQTFPKPIKLGYSSRWKLSDILIWIDSRIAQRDKLHSV